MRASQTEPRAARLQDEGGLCKHRQEAPGKGPCGGSSPAFQGTLEPLGAHTRVGSAQTHPESSRLSVPPGEPSLHMDTEDAAPWALQEGSLPELQGRLPQEALLTLSSPVELSSHSWCLQDIHGLQSRAQEQLGSGGRGSQADTHPAGSENGLQQRPQGGCVVKRDPYREAHGGRLPRAEPWKDGVGGLPLPVAGWVTCPSLLASWRSFTTPCPPHPVLPRLLQDRGPGTPQGLEHTLVPSGPAAARTAILSSSCTTLSAAGSPHAPACGHMRTPRVHSSGLPARRMPWPRWQMVVWWDPCACPRTQALFPTNKGSYFPFTVTSCNLYPLLPPLPGCPHLSPALLLQTPPAWSSNYYLSPYSSQGVTQRGGGLLTCFISLYSPMPGRECDTCEMIDSFGWVDGWMDGYG